MQMPTHLTTTQVPTLPTDDSSSYLPSYTESQCPTSTPDPSMSGTDRLTIPSHLSHTSLCQH